MKEENKVIKTNSLLYEEVAVCDCVSCTPSPSNCCCTSTQTVSFDTCTDTIKSISVAPSTCSGRVLHVTVNLADVCCPSNVTVAVVICDPITKKLIAIQAKTVSIASTVTCTPTPAPGVTEPCTPACVRVNDVVEFCFAFEGICDPQSFIVNAIANYSFAGKRIPCPCAL